MKHAGHTLGSIFIIGRMYGLLKIAVLIGAIPMC